MATRPGSSRRTFLGASAAALAAPTIVPASVFGKPGQPAPSDRVVVGSIGTGDLGRRHHLNNKLIPNPRIQVAAVCDVDRNHRDAAAADVLAKTGKQPAIYKDFRDLCDRDDIDAVLIATPDHWHALTAIYAMESGKDVYCEKPLTLTIEEGRKMVEVARRYGTVFQTGSQQRSDRRFRLACELVFNGAIGKLQTIDTHIGNIDSGSWQPVTTPPPELDWNMWLGPAPYVDYAPNRCHYQFRWFLDYSGGKMTDWGAHHNDIAQWGLGNDISHPEWGEGLRGPVKARPEMVKFHENGPHDVAGDFDVVYTYANGVELRCHSSGENGVKFTGQDGYVFVSRGRIEASLGGKVHSDNKDKIKQGAELDIFAEVKPESFAKRLYESRDHHENWLDCIASRARPICDVEIGHRSCTICHLGTIALRLGREVAWDPEAQGFVGDEQAQAMYSRPMRAPWRL